MNFTDSCVLTCFMREAAGGTKNKSPRRVLAAVKDRIADDGIGDDLRPVRQG